MEQVKKHLAILNLTGEFVPELASYFADRGILVVDPLSCTESYDWTHILTKDIHDYTLINKTYQVTEKERSIISLTKVDDLQNFVLNNGNFVIDEMWFKTALGGFILDKYFVGHAGINLKDNYPTFREIGSFNVANPFNTGEYLDKLTQKAFKEGIDGLSIKTYFDHLLMFITGLKNKGKTGLPFEVTYGTYEEVFGVQIHFFAKNLELLDVTTCLRSSMSKKPEEYYLNVAVQSSDFFEFSFLPEVDKAIVTALWSKDSRIKFENRGFMMTSVRGNQALVKYLTNDEDTSDFSGDSTSEDFTNRISIPDELPEDIKENFVKGFKETGEEARAVANSNPEKTTANSVISDNSSGNDLEENRRMNGTLATPESSTKVSESPLSKDEVSIIKSGSVLKELVQQVKGKVEEDKHEVKIAGDKIDVDKLAIKISSSLKETSEKMNLQVRSLGNNLPHAIKTGLYDFAKNQNKPIEDLNDEEIEAFQLNSLSEVIKNELLSTILKDKDLGQDQLKQQLNQLETTLDVSKDQNDKLKLQMASLVAENHSLKERSLKLLRQHAQVKEDSKNLRPVEDLDEEIRKHFAQKLSSGKPVSEEDLKKLSMLLEREAKLINDLRNEELKSRKLAIEGAQKEVLLEKEIQNSDRKMRAKDLMISKTKETLTRLVDKKDQELAKLRIKVEELSKTLMTMSPKTFIQKIHDLEKQNQNLYKQLDQYKDKITTLSATIHSLKSDDPLKEESRKVSMINLQLKNQLSHYQREVEKLKTKSSLDTAQIIELRTERLKLDQQLKKLSFEDKRETTAIMEASGQSAEIKRMLIQNQSLETQLKDSAYKISNLETKLSEALRASKVQSAGDESKARVSQFEASIKKLSQDNNDLKNKLDEAKKELNKARQEKTALQNLTDKLKKDAEKGKPATPKKPGGKAA